MRFVLLLTLLSLVPAVFVGDLIAGTGGAVLASAIMGMFGVTSAVIVLMYREAEATRNGA